MDLNKQESEQESVESRNNLITTFIEITSSTTDEACFFLESHNFVLEAAVSTFFESTAADLPPAEATGPPSASVAVNSSRNSLSSSPSISPSVSVSDEDEESAHSPDRSRSRSRSPPHLSSTSRKRYNLRSKRQMDTDSTAAPGNSSRRKILGSASVSGSGQSGRIQTLGDLNRSSKGEEENSDEDPDWEPRQDTGGENRIRKVVQVDEGHRIKTGSGVPVKEALKEVDADEIFEQARRFAAATHLPDQSRPSSSRSFTGTMRKLSGEAKESSQKTTRVVTLWRNGFTVDNGPLRRLDDPVNERFLKSIRHGDCPKELASSDGLSETHVDLVRRDENHPEPSAQTPSFLGVGRTLGSSDDPCSNSNSTRTSSTLVSASSPLTGLAVNQDLPSTSIQLRLADGTRLVSRFNLNHTIRDLHAFINASRPGGGGGAYTLQAMGFPPKQLTNLDQTLEEAGLINSVVMQKF